MRKYTRFAAAVVSAVALSGWSAAAAVASGPSAGLAAARGAAATKGPSAAVTRSPAAIAPRWTRVSSGTGLGIASAGLLRTADRRLHLVWASHDKAKFSLHYSTVGAHAKLVATGTIVSHWSGIDFVPKLVPAAHGGLRVIFDGANGQNGSPYNVGTFYSATAGPSGTGWALQPGSLSHSDLVPATDSSATIERNGLPVTAWSTVSALTYHVGIDPNVPAKAPDVQIPVGPSGAVINPTLLTDSAGTVWGAWFNSSLTSTMGYWVDRIFSGASGLRKAPGSGSVAGNNNQPRQAVAFAARAGGGVYMAYCAAAKNVSCNHIALWRVGAARAMTVPGSRSGLDSKVALAAAPGGHLWVLWFNYRSNVIQAVRTNAAATAFGRVLTIRPPSRLFNFLGLQAQGSTGPLDIVALAQAGGTSSPAYFDAQILPPLSLRASKAKVSVRGTVTFTVLDSGTPVSGAVVTFLGHKAVTNAKGTVRFTVRKGTRTGKRTATAAKRGYSPARVTVTVK
jgi:hypothetical protein